MDNPLKRFFPVEEREDGVYIQVSRDVRDGLTAEMVITSLEQAMVLNADPVRVRDVIQRARGAFEKVGQRFEYYDVQLDVMVDVRITPMRAVLKIDPDCIASKIFLSEGALIHALHRKGVIFGIKRDVVAEMVKKSIFGVEMLIAEGSLPVKGDNAALKYEIEINPDVKPAILPDGTVDFREIKTFTQVAKGQVIAKKVPATPGTPGKSVTGEAIPAQPGVDRPLVEGKNIAVSNDGKYLVVTKSGIIYEEAGMLNINETLVVRHDVDFSVGNIKFTGTVNITGNVLPGFTVESEEDIVINGEVEGATIRSRNGTVSIKNGVIGKGQTVIFGKKGVRVGFAQDAKINTEGALTVDRFCLHCTCTCDSFEMSRADAGFIGGELKAFNFIKAANIGSEKGLTTRLLLVDKERDALLAKSNELEQLLAKLNDEVAPVKKQLASKAAIFKKAGDAVTDRQKEELKKWIEQHNSLNIKVEYVQKKINDLKLTLQTPVDAKGWIQVSGNVYPGVAMEFYGLLKQVTSTMTNKKFVAGGGEIDTVG